MEENGNGVSVSRMTFSLTDVIKIVLVAVGAVAFYFQVNGRLDALDSQIAGLRAQQEQLRVDLGVVRGAQIEESASSPAGRSPSRTRSSTR